MEEPKRTMTRQELHDLVWSTPMQKLAEIYGISDRGLAKTCERHLVPVPPRGYWAKITAGQTVKRSPLRPVENTALHSVHIGTSPSIKSAYAAEVIEAAFKKIRSQDDIPVDNRPAGDSLAPPKKKPQPTKIDVKAETSIHSAVAPVLRELWKAKKNRHGFVEFKYISTHPAEIERIGIFLSVLLRNLEPYGFEFDFSGYSIGFRHGDSIVFLDISTPRKRNARPSRIGGEFHEYEHIGRMAVRVSGSSNGTRKEWVDTEGRRVEAAIDEIVESLRVNMLARKDEDEVARLKKERQAHLARRRELASLRAKREEERLEFLNWIAKARREADDLRVTIAAIPESGSLPEDYQRMINWAECRLAEVEAETNIERIQERLVERKLYTDPDHLFDPEGDPPPKTNYWDD